MRTLLAEDFDPSRNASNSGLFWSFAESASCFTADSHGAEPHALVGRRGSSIAPWRPRPHA